MLPAITRENIGRLRPGDLIGAAKLFDHLYRQAG